MPPPATHGGLWGKVAATTPHLRGSHSARITYSGHDTYGTQTNKKARATPTSCPGERSAAP